MGSIEDLSRVSIGRETVVTIGVFDGVHLGHRHLMERLSSIGQTRGLDTVVVTFRNHPRVVLVPGATVPLITSVDERILLLKATGIGNVVPLSFTKELSRLTAREFAEALVKDLQMKCLVAGPDFAMGRGREGTLPRLRALGTELGFSVETVEPFSLESHKISSTIIREQLGRGEVVLAARCLGRLPSLAGRVVVGERRGRRLGFPTANLDIPPEILLPADGVYCTIAHLGTDAHDSVTNIGIRPTFGENERLVEVYIMDFEGDIYGKELRIELVERIREEKRFASVDELKVAIAEDVQRARELLESRVKT